uniref:Distal membrane-arm assembly complex protein 1-like domain-containing protein n=1 Tax=Peronospora matthiolae TaxID=2874970 RepID=A0AAV1VCJ1_9STRA
MAAQKSEIDCLGCRLTGSVTLLGVGGYFLNERMKVPRHDLRQRRWLLACAGAFAAAGVWRATSHLFETPQGLGDGDDDSSSESHGPYTP